MFTCSPQFTKLVNRPLTKSRESAAPYTPKCPRVPRHLADRRANAPTKPVVQRPGRGYLLWLRRIWAST
ncbi:hypothetical protein DND90_11160 [Pseudomonas syringae pv. maculicola]|nr:hypothetical protein DND90_11160 [Pseudomonas syringae pv. maculicola]